MSRYQIAESYDDAEAAPRYHCSARDEWKRMTDEYYERERRLQREESTAARSLEQRRREIIQTDTWAAERAALDELIRDPSVSDVDKLSVVTDAMPKCGWQNNLIFRAERALLRAKLTVVDSERDEAIRGLRLCIEREQDAAEQRERWKRGIAEIAERLRKSAAVEEQIHKEKPEMSSSREAFERHVGTLAFTSSEQEELSAIRAIARIRGVSNREKLEALDDAQVLSGDDARKLRDAEILFLRAKLAQSPAERDAMIADLEKKWSTAGDPSDWIRWKDEVNAMKRNGVKSVSKSKQTDTGSDQKSCDAQGDASALVSGIKHRAKRVMKEASKRAPVELGLTMTHDFMAAQVADALAGGDAEANAKIRAQIVTFAKSKYSEASLGVLIAALLVAVGPLTGEKQDVIDAAADEFATRGLTVAGVAAGGDAIAALEPLKQLAVKILKNFRKPTE